MVRDAPPVGYLGPVAFDMSISGKREIEPALITMRVKRQKQSSSSCRPGAARRDASISFSPLAPRTMQAGRKGEARSAGAFGNDIQQLLCDGGTCLLRAAVCQHLLFTIDIGFDGAPSRSDLPATGSVCMPNIDGAC
jgi:hypothetical protein